MVQDLENEVWVEIKGYELLYAVSNLGRVKALPKTITGGVAPVKKVEMLLKPQKKESGYLRVALSINCKARFYAIHRLVMLSFVGKHPTLKEVNHLNGDKEDNSLSNLEWSNRSLNIKHSFEVLGRDNSKTSPFQKGDKHILYGKNPSNAKKIKCDTLGLEFESFAIAERELGIYKGAINEMFSYNRKHVNGLTFRKS